MLSKSNLLVRNILKSTIRNSHDHGGVPGKVSWQKCYVTWGYFFYKIIRMFDTIHIVEINTETIGFVKKIYYYLIALVLYLGVIRYKATYINYLVIAYLKSLILLKFL